MSRGHLSVEPVAKTALSLYGCLIGSAGITPGMRRYALIALAVAVLVVTAGCTGFTTTANSAQSGDDAETRTITVSASGEASTDPNNAIVRVTILASGDTASEAREDVAADANAVRDALLEYGIDDDDIETTRYRIDPQYSDRDRTDPTGYRAIHTYEVTVNDPEAAGEVIDTAVGAGADRVEDVRFGVDDDTQTELRQAALENAMENAKGDAEAIAGASNVRIVQVHSVDASSSSPRIPRVEYAMAGDGGGHSTSIDSGPVSVTVQVTVEYEID